MRDITVLKRYDWSGGCYEWSTAEVGVDEVGDFWIRYGSGCSCNDISDELWEPLRDTVQLNSIATRLAAEPEDLPLKASFIAFAQGLL